MYSNYINTIRDMGQLVEHYKKDYFISINGNLNLASVNSVWFQRTILTVSRLRMGLFHTDQTKANARTFTICASASCPLTTSKMTGKIIKKAYPAFTTVIHNCQLSSTLAVSPLSQRSRPLSRIVTQQVLTQTDRCRL